MGAIKPLAIWNLTIYGTIRVSIKSGTATLQPKKKLIRLVITVMPQPHKNFQLRLTFFLIVGIL